MLAGYQVFDIKPFDDLIREAPKPAVFKTDGGSSYDGKFVGKLCSMDWDQSEFKQGKCKEKSQGFYGKDSASGYEC